MTDVTVSEASVPETLSSRERIVLGALGGIVVSVFTYPALQQGYADLIRQGDIVQWIGFLARPVGFGVLGGIWGYVHRPETDPRRAFQLGLVAPAMIAGFIYANQSEASTTTAAAPQPAPASDVQPVQGSTAGFPAVTVQTAQAIGPAAAPRPSEPRKPSIVDRLLKGFLGK